MSHYDNLPIEIQTYIGHYIPYKHPIQDFQKEYKIFCQDWKNQTQAKQWEGLDPELSFNEDEVVFLNKAYFNHQLLKQFFTVNYSLENGIIMKRKPNPPKYRRNTI